MAKILTFKNIIAPVRVQSGDKHRVALQVTDAVRPRRTRWETQFDIQDASGFRALAGFTDKAVAAGYSHRFTISSTRALRVFVAGTSDLVATGRIALWVDGKRVQPYLKRRA